MSKAFKNSGEELQRIWNRQMEFKISLAIPLVTGGLFLASKIINSIYGPNFIPSILVFQILIIAGGILYLNTVLNQALVATNNQKKSLFSVFSSAIIAIVLNIMLIPKFGLYGAAVAFLLAMLLRFILFLFFILKFTNIRPFNHNIFTSFVVSMIATIPMYYSISYLNSRNLNIFILVIAGGLIYSLSLMLFKKYLPEKDTNL
jgi:O-antigen/teichoic acid export membrane protein